MLILGGFLMAAASLLAGASGFGLALVATPLLLLCGFSLPFVVTVNLLVTLLTRTSVAWRLRHAIDRTIVALLVAGAVPGLWLGTLALGSVDEHALKLCTGVLVAVAAVALAATGRRSAEVPRPAPTAGAGFAGGVLGTTTSLVGVPPALLLSRSRLPNAEFFANLSVYFVATAAIGLAVLSAHDQVSGDAARAFVYWAPGVVVANLVGTSLGLRIPGAAFRGITHGLAFAAGIATAITAYSL